MRIHTSLTVRAHPGAGVQHHDHDDPDPAHALAWIHAHLPGTALLVLLNLWTEHPHQPPRDLLHAGGPAETVTAALTHRFTDPADGHNKYRIRAETNTPDNAHSAPQNHCSRTRQLLDWMAI